MFPECSQEAAAMFIEKTASTPLGGSHLVLGPEKMDGKRDQNSMILLAKSAFKADTVREVTPQVFEGKLCSCELRSRGLCSLKAQQILKP
jgi:hypothetical protein